MGFASIPNIQEQSVHRKEIADEETAVISAKLTRGRRGWRPLLNFAWQRRRLRKPAGRMLSAATASNKMLSTAKLKSSASRSLWNRHRRIKIPGRPPVDYWAYS